MPIKRLKSAPPYKQVCIFMLLLALIFSIFNYMFLTRYPLADIDEAWISNATKNLFNNGQMDLTIYKCRDNVEGYDFGKLHLACEHMLFNLFGYSLLAARLVSFISILACSILIYFIVMKLVADKLLSCLSTCLFLISEQAVYSSHLARQEAMLALWFLLCLFIFLKIYDSQKWYKHLCFGLLCGLSFEIHLNAMILCLAYLTLYLFFKPDPPYLDKLKKISLWGIGIIIMLAIWWLGRSFFNPDFYRVILIFAKEKSLGFNPLGKLYNNALYFYQIFWKEAYHRKITDFIFIMVILGGAIFLLRKKELDKKYRETFRLFLLILLSIDVGFLLMGRYNRHYITLIYPFIIPLGVVVLSSLNNFLPKRLKVLPLVFLILFGLLNLGKNVCAFYICRNSDYNHYIKNLRQYIPTRSVVIGDIAYQYGFSDSDYISSSDLAYAATKGINIETYFRMYRVEYIIFTQFWDCLSKNQPKDKPLNYEEYQRFFKNRCFLLATIEDPYYGLPLPHDGKCWTKIYKVIL